MATKSSVRKSTKKKSSNGLSPRTKKAIRDSPVPCTTHLYKSAHERSRTVHKSPSKRRGGKRQSREQVAHKVAWAAVKKA